MQKCSSEWDVRHELHLEIGSSCKVSLLPLHLSPFCHKLRQEEDSSTMQAFLNYLLQDFLPTLVEDLVIVVIGYRAVDKINLSIVQRSLCWLVICTRKFVVTEIRVSLYFTAV